MDISIIGSGYVGLVTGACFADVGHNVICVDNDPRKVEALQAGKIPIYEPGLEEVVHRNVSAQRLRFTGSIKEGVDNSQIVFIAVPTPQQPDGSVDLSFIEKVAREIAGVLTSYRVIVDKSTVPVKTGEKVKESIKRYNKHGAEFDVVSNPEFLREGCAVADLMQPDRIVIGIIFRPLHYTDSSLKRVAATLEKCVSPLHISEAIVGAEDDRALRRLRLRCVTLPASERVRGLGLGSDPRAHSSNDGCFYKITPREFHEPSCSLPASTHNGFHKTDDDLRANRGSIS